jgi:CPA2 family monovalent cation:H+ antiporter-2
VSHELHLILNVAVAVAIALLGGLIAHRLRQSVIVGYLLAGVAIGPFTPGFVGDRGEIGALAEVGVIFLMFALGIEFSLKELARVRGVALVGTTLQVLLTIAGGAGLAALLGWPLTTGLFFGGIISISSTMVILKTLLERGEVAAHHGRVLLGMLVVQDLAAVLLIVLLPKLASGGGDLLPGLAWTVLTAATFIGVTLFLGARVVPRLMARVERLRSPDLFLLTAVALALGIATASALLGLSPALGAFMAGLLLTETEFDHRVVAEVVPMRNLFATLFFVSVGMLIDPGFILANLPVVVGLAVGVMLIKALATGLSVLPFRLGARTALYTGLGMIQIGEFSYVIAQAGRQVGAISDTLNSLILTSSLLTIMLTPAAFGLAGWLDRRLAGVGWVQRRLGREAPVTDDASLEGHAIVIGYGRVGSRVVAGLGAAGLPVVVVEEDLHLVHGLTEAGLPAVYGDAAHASVMAAAHPERARLVVVSLPDVGATREIVRATRRANPTLPILARAARFEEVETLQRLGATQVIAPEQAGAVLLLESSAHELGLHPELLLQEREDGTVQPVAG